MMFMLILLHIFAQGKEAILLSAAVDPSQHVLVVVLLCSDLPPKGKSDENALDWHVNFDV